ncbi:MULTISPECIES: TonB-system energizer ExbB [unclassified Nitratiruptor]|uniref:TonB-system energizer ExbB n=1 Tax=unclassified Nitratiruptor TaxID=2624044 RepID=UPI001915CEFC|nr:MULTISPECIES: TonB-system energizer ExbB [unclassified Nitratiruptor]BCD60731.1 biopolymer transport protein ExbB [Nitratiruptor sp. YY08-10]BCD64663.1 biopolymer transport protein ExbB [Nitratiruptor sp. YY08-14]
MSIMQHLKEIIDYGIIGTLAVMSFVSVWLTIERWFFYRGVDVSKYENKEALEIDITNNLSTIATIASSAPYIGLLGTVLGIILTFYTMGQSGIVNTKEIMIGLALALKATAMGLVVAIPATMFYNYLVRRVEVLLAKWDIVHED